MPNPQPISSQPPTKPPRGIKAQRLAARRARVASLFLSGVINRQELADILGVHRRSINEDLKFLEAQWREEAARDFASWVDVLRQKLADRERELKAWWARTQRSKETHRVKTGGGQPGEAESSPEVTKEVTGQAGDARFFEAHARLWEQHKELVAMVLRQDASQPQVQHNTQINLNLLPDDLLARLKQEVDRQLGIEDVKVAISLDENTLEGAADGEAEKSPQGDEIEAEFEPEEAKPRQAEAA